MSIPYVCSACRLARLTSRSVRTQQQRQLQQTVRALPQQATPEQETRRPLVNGSWAESQQTGVDGSRVVVFGRYSGEQLRPEQLLTQLDRTALKSRGRREQRGTTGIYRPPGKRYVEPFEVPADVRVLRDDLYSCSMADDYSAAWSILQELVDKFISRPPRHRAGFLNLGNVGRTVSILLSRSIKELVMRIRTGQTNPGMPTPYQVLLLLHNAYVVQPIYYRPTLWVLADHLWNLHHDASINNKALRKGVDELMGMWRLCIGGYLSHKSFGKGAEDAKNRAFASVATLEDDWTFLPSASVFSSWADRQSSTMFEEMLGLLVAQVKPLQDPSKTDSPGRSDYASAALLTLDLLNTTNHASSDGNSVPLATLPRYAVFANLLEAMLQVASSPRTPPLLEAKLASWRDPVQLDRLRAMLTRMGCEIPPVVASKETEEAYTPAVLLKSADAPSTNEPGREHNSDDATAVSHVINYADAAVSKLSESERFTNMQVDRLVKMMQSQNITWLPRIVREVFSYSETHKDKEQLPIELYEHMLLTSLSLRDTKTTVEVWQHMIGLGIKPTVKTYTVMMRGAQNARDVQGMEMFFHRMRQAGLQPDAYTWTIRIFGLLKLRNVKAGMQALSEMGQEWFAAAHAKAEAEGTLKKEMHLNKISTLELLEKYPGPIDGVPRPNLEIMNAAISGLATARPAEVPRVFSWGRSFGIEPDLATFNTLISVSMKGKRAEDALGVLREMQQRGIQADTTTWTVLLSSLFESGFLDNLSHEAQQAKIFTFMDALTDKSVGVSGLNAMGYALIIDRLLKHYQNDTAAAAVLSHMLSHGHKPTTHIHTILMTNFFDRQPQPDFSAIDNLWRQIQDPTGRGFMPATSVDTIFYDRMVEGYARYHHLVGIRPMEDFLQRCRASGKKPGWKALQSVGRVYAERQLWSKLRTLIDEARIAMRDQAGRMSKSGEREFWDFVHDTGILKSEGYVRREDYESDVPVGSPLMRAEDEYARRKAEAGG